MDYPLIIGGKHLFRSPFQGNSQFYAGYEFPVSNASQLDIASAIGAVRMAEPPPLAERRKLLEKAASSFEFADPLAEHVVRMTGMPVSLIRGALGDIKRVFRQVPETYHQRFSPPGKQDHFHQEEIGTQLSKLLIPPGGFCYAVTPGIDPRAAAIVAANLGYLGIPFILRASIRDAVAPLIIEAMLKAGFDPRFCNLVYLDRRSGDFKQKHFKILNAGSCIWTFGPSHLIDQSLRYQNDGYRVSIDLQNLTGEIPPASDLKDMLGSMSADEFEQLIEREAKKADRFEGKTVIRHESGNCAAILYGVFDEQLRTSLYPALGYANVCTALKSLMFLGDGDQITQAADYLADLVAGDPLLDDTQVGYIDPRNLDHLAHLTRINSLHIQTYGGERLSPVQARPLLVTGEGDLADFLGQEIPAYVLTARACPNLEQAVSQLNMHLKDKARLAVSLFNLPENLQRSAVQALSAHIILIDKPTSILLPAVHEGNDYALLLTRGKIIYS